MFLIHEFFTEGVRMRIAFLLCGFVGLMTLMGCAETAPKVNASGAEDYSLNGKPIHEPNQVRIDNPYTFSVRVDVQDRQVIIQPGSSKYVIFEGMLNAGPVRVWKLASSNRTSSTKPGMSSGNAVDHELTYKKMKTDLVGGITVYQVR